MGNRKLSPPSSSRLTPLSFSCALSYPPTHTHPTFTPCYALHSVPPVFTLFPFIAHKVGHVGHMYVVQNVSGTQKHTQCLISFLPVSEGESTECSYKTPFNLKICSEPCFLQQQLSLSSGTKSLLRIKVSPVSHS